MYINKYELSESRYHQFDALTSKDKERKNGTPTVLGTKHSFRKLFIL